MHTFLNRANALFAYAFSCVATVTFLCFLSTALIDQQPEVDILAHPVKLVSRHQFRHLHGRKSDKADLSFDISVDMSSLYNWNVKELFLYIVAEYATDDNELNQIVLWDHIMERHKGDGLVQETSVRPEYDFFDDGQGLRGNKNVTLGLCWNIIPNAGTLPRKCNQKIDLPLPDNYWS
eukprot:m.83595 g.83595  ORF g.83595 m.83595 type:complete len:178 (+) comp12929_c0_seq3:135-668(+)